MSLKKRKGKDLPENITERKQFPEIYSDFNQTASNNPSHLVDENTNYFQRDITYEMIDKSVYDFFNEKLLVSHFNMPLILLDRDFMSMRYENYMQYDTLNEYLNPPFFTMYRNAVKPLWRVSPANKMVSYTIPKLKNSIVYYEQYLSPPPRWEILTYEFKFISNYRERTNEFENQMNELFKNKRNIVFVDTGERFEIKPEDQNTRSELEKMYGSTNQIQRVFVLTYRFEVHCYIRLASNTQKKERKSIIEYSIVESDGKTEEKIQNFSTRIIS